MMDSKIDGLMVVEALQRSSLIKTSIPTHEIAAAVLAGMIVIVKGAFDSHEMQRLRAAIIASKILDYGPDQQSYAKSSRHRRANPPESPTKWLYDNYRFALNNPDDEIGPAVRAVFERLASYWRSLTGRTHAFVPDADGQAVRPTIMHYPIGGGHLDWHAHRPEPTQIGLILAMSEIGIDFQTGETEFKTPFGVVSTGAIHDNGDVCLFRYDLAHRVTPVDIDRERRWDGAGRWSLIIPVQ